MIEDKTWTIELSHGGVTMPFPAVEADTFEEACRKVLAKVDVVSKQTRTVLSTGILAKLA